MSTMNDLHDSSDLIALEVLLQTRNVTQAAVRLGITQSAMSHTLARLRQRFDDPLLVRSGRGLVRTALAEAMSPRLSAALAELRSAVQARVEFDPARSRATFRFGTTDMVELVVLPRLVARLSEEAPGVDLHVLGAADGETALIEDRLDLLCQPLREPTPAGLRARALYSERFVCMLRPQHPLCAGPQSTESWTTESFAAARHALVAPRGNPGGVTDRVLAGLGHQRRTVLLVPSFLAVAHIVAASDLVVTLPERVARTIAAPLGLTVREPPFEIPGFRMHLLWHERHDAHPAHRWLRAKMVEAAEQV